MPSPVSPAAVDQRLPGAGSMGQLRTHDSAIPHLPSDLRDTVEQLMHAFLASASRAQYEQAWSKLVVFFQSHGSVPALPVSVAMLLLFVAHLHNTGLAPSAIISTESAISYFHKINGCQDPAKNFIISELLAGAQNLWTGSDIRLPQGTAKYAYVTL